MLRAVRFVADHREALELASALMGREVKEPLLVVVHQSNALVLRVVEGQGRGGDGLEERASLDAEDPLVEGSRVRSVPRVRLEVMHPAEELVLVPVDDEGLVLRLVEGDLA